MAKFENEGYCPCNWVPKMWDEETDQRLAGLWSLVGPVIVYEKADWESCAPNTTACDQVFGVDPIACDLLSSIIRKNANAYKILIHQLHCGACNTQALRDIQQLIAEVENPELVLHAGSNFAAILADAEHGLDVYIWDLRVTQ